MGSSKRLDALLAEDFDALRFAPAERVLSSGAATLAEFLEAERD